MSPLRRLDVHLFGPGLVGSALLDQIQACRSALHAEGLDLRVVTIARSSTLLHRPEGIDLAAWRWDLERQGIPWSFESWLDLHPAGALVDCTTSASLPPRYLQAFDAGLHVVAANKKANSGSLAFYRSLRERAQAAGRQFLYETNAGAGLPLIDPLRQLVRTGDRIHRVEGILSGSLSFILGLLGEGLPLSMAVRTAMAKGFTEPDPRDDLSGMDVMRKVLILARESGFPLEPEQVQVEGLLPASFDASGTVEAFVDRLVDLDERFGTRIATLRAQERVLRYVGSVTPDACTVGPVGLELDHPLAAVQGGENAVAIASARYSPYPMVIRGYGAGAEVTAGGVFSDLLRLEPQDRS